MSYTGKVKNGVVILPPGVKLAEGTEVSVAPRNAAGGEDSLALAVKRAAKPRAHWPQDYALNHGHYVSGEPKKA